MFRLQFLRPLCIRSMSRKFLRDIYLLKYSLATNAIVRMIDQPIRVEDEEGVHGSLGNVTMEKSENWPENTMVTLNIYTLNIYTLLQGVVQFVTLNSSLGTIAYQHYSYCTRISGNLNLKRRLFSDIRFGNLIYGAQKDSPMV